MFLNWCNNVTTHVEMEINDADKKLHNGWRFSFTSNILIVNNLDLLKAENVTKYNFLFCFLPFDIYN